MILNPCERFYEFEAKLEEIVSRLQMLTIWRPDAPSKTELESLRSLVLHASGPTAEAEPEGDVLSKIRPILASLYISRGHLVSGSHYHAICEEIKDRNISRYLSACLSRLPLHGVDSVDRISFPAEAVHQNQDLRWAALLTGHPELPSGSAAQAREQLLQWWTNRVEALSSKLPDFPEAFRTTRFWNKIKYIQGPLLALKPVFHSLRSGAFSFLEAMDHVGLNFAWDQDRLLKWMQGLESLGGLAQWLPPSYMPGNT